MMHDGIPSEIWQVEFSALQYVLQFEEDFVFSLATLMQVRRELRQVIELSGAAAGQMTQLRSLIEPPALTDPVARRRYRKPGPGFVLHSPVNLPQSLASGDEIVLPVRFFGRARGDVAVFTELLMTLGRQGLANGEGVFTLQEIRCEGQPASQSLWTSGCSLANMSVPYQDLGWWLEQRRDAASLTWSIVTPARLLRNRKPLFNADFSDLFPFALRRVTSMLYTWGGCEVVADPSVLLQAADSVSTVAADLHWQDWRVLQGSSHRQELGGLVGSIILSGAGLASVSWVLFLLELFNLGKGAAYGAGQCVLRAGEPGCQAAE